MSDDEGRIPFSEQSHELQERHMRRRTALLLVLQLYAVLGALFAALAAVYFIFLKYGIELTAEEKQALAAAAAGVFVSGISLFAANFLKISLQRDNAERFAKLSDNSLVGARAAISSLTDGGRQGGRETNSVPEDLATVLKQLPIQAGSHLYSSIFVERWSVFERACRELASLDKAPMSQLLKILSTKGMLTEEEVLLARECLMVRNDIVHGTGRSKRTLDELSALVDILNDLILTVGEKANSKLEVDNSD